MNGGDEVTATAPASPPLEWKFSQVFGEPTAGEELQEGKIFRSSKYFQGFGCLGLGSGSKVCELVEVAEYWGFFRLLSFFQLIFFGSEVHAMLFSD